MEPFNRGNSDIFKLEVDAAAKSNFLEMARWTKFLAILGFVFLGLMLAAGIFFGLNMSDISSAYGGNATIAGATGVVQVLIIVLFVIIVAVYIYPTYALLKYSSCIKTAIAAENKEQFNLAIKYLKNMFKYIGILMIICLVLYGLEIIFVIIAAMNR